MSLEDKIDLNELQRRLLDIKLYEVFQSQSVEQYNKNMKSFLISFEYTRQFYPEVFRTYQVPDYRGVLN